MFIAFCKSYVQTNHSSVLTPPQFQSVNVNVRLGEVVILHSGSLGKGRGVAWGAVFIGMYL